MVKLSFLNFRDNKMTNIIYKENIVPNDDDIKNLYNDAGWVIYVKNIPLIQEAMKNSLYIETAWDNGKLVGLIRVVGDGATIIYVQDLLVLKTHKRMGIGTQLVRGVCKKYKDVRQKVLLTDDNQETRGFYESLGFHSCDKGQLIAFVKLK